MTRDPLTLDEVTEELGQRIKMYRWHRPHYQWAMLNGLAAQWAEPHPTVLDIGGGTGIIGQAVQDLFPPAQVTSVDVEDRFLDDLDVKTLTFDGRRLPFGAEQFSAATINNVMHHVEIPDRVPLMTEVRRVVSGPVYIKDHVATGRLDNVRLAILDLMGNLPFSGMLKARYLTRAHWEELAAATGYEIDWGTRQTYRRGPFALLFPNRLEVTMRWTPVR